MPTVGFTPDGRFPVIYAEKGIATPTLSTPIPSTTTVMLARISAGERSNLVPDRAFISFKGNSETLAKIMAQLVNLPSLTAIQEGNTLSVSAVGVGAHASLPHEGINAIGLLCAALLRIEELSEFKPLLFALHQFAVDNSGVILGIAGSDEPSGPLTSNLGVVKTENGSIAATFSIRYPVTWAEADVRSNIELAARSLGFSLTEWHHQGPLHVPKDSVFLTTLLDVYRAETGDMQEPQSMGGGTYARVLKQGVAFGPNFPGFPDNAHQADEFWSVADLMRAAKIYAKALIRLAT
jgi:succinyl-diaminopimelate desuccinylase